METQIDLSTGSGTLYTIAVLPGGVLVHSIITEQLNTMELTLWFVLCFHGGYSW